MKKRILSFLLATMMVLTTLVVLPISVSAAEYSYNFEADDIRNVVDGQVFDVAKYGEADVPPAIDGVWGNNEYQSVGTMPVEARESLSAVDEDESVDVAFSVKDGYLYFAIKYDGADTAQRKIQYDIGVLQGPSSEGAWSRKQVTWNADNSTTNQGSLIKAPGTSDWQSGTTWNNAGTSAVDSDIFLVDKKYSDGVYEAMFNLAPYYDFFAGSCRGEGIYDTPCVTVAFFYNAGNSMVQEKLKDDGVTIENDVNKNGVLDADPYLPRPAEVGQTHYAFKTSAKIESTCTVSWVPATVIIPEYSRALIEAKKDLVASSVGEFGYDNRNAVAGQHAVLASYAEVAPTMDGIVDPGEYTTTHLIDHNLDTTYGKVTARYAVKDGYLYVAIAYAEATHGNAYFQYGLTANDGATGISRSSATLYTNSTASYYGIGMKDADSPSSWVSDTGRLSTMFSGLGAGHSYAVVDSASSNTSGITTYEVKLSLATMINTYSESGWDEDATNAVHFIIFANCAKQIAYNTSETVENQIRTASGISYHCGYVNPTVLLPADCISKVKAEIAAVDSVVDLEYFGQPTAHTAPATAKLDGLVSNKEYSGSYSWTNDDLRVADSTFDPGINCEISGTDYFAYDDQYLYFACEVKDPTYYSGTSFLQINFNVPNITDNKIDLGDGVTRINMVMKVTGNDTDGYTAALSSAPSWIIRNQNSNTDTLGIGEAVKAEYSKFECAGNYNSTTNIITYELRVPLSSLVEIFDVECIEKISYLTHIYFCDSEYKDHANTDGANPVGPWLGVWNLFKLRDYGTWLYMYDRTAEDAGLTTPQYYNNFFGNVIHLTSFGTKDAASARLSSATPTNSGLRFKTYWSAVYLAELQAEAKAAGKTFEIGTLIAPASYVEAAGAFTHAALEAKYATDPYVDVAADVDKAFDETTMVVTYAGSLVNIKNVTMEFAGIGYVKVGDTYYYSDNYCVRSVQEVAAAALADTNKTYTPMQTAILNALANGTSLDQVNQ